MALHWIREVPPRWDAGKQRLFGPQELAAVGYAPPPDGSVLPNEWWRVTDDDGAVVGYGWLDSAWGDAEITFVVDRARRRAGIGEFIVDQLEAEAADRGLNYIYNVIPDTHPDPSAMARWLTARRFVAGPGDLRRRVRAVTTDTQ